MSMGGDLDRTVHRTGARTDGIDFVMVGLKRPSGGVRIYATRHMPHLEWGQVQRDYATLWHIDADMDNLLVIDKPDYPQALARLFEIWASQDAEAKLALPGRQHAQTAEHSGHLRYREMIEGARPPSA